MRPKNLILRCSVAPDVNVKVQSFTRLYSEKLHAWGMFEILALVEMCSSDTLKALQHHSSTAKSCVNMRLLGSRSSPGAACDTPTDCKETKTYLCGSEGATEKHLHVVP